MLSVLKMRTANEHPSLPAMEMPALLKVKTDLFETKLEHNPAMFSIKTEQEDEAESHEDRSMEDIAEDDETEDMDMGMDPMENGDESGMGKLEKRKRKPVPMCIKCPVCGSPAPGHVHFGGQCCYSCRAFFRRTSLRPILSFKCRGGEGKCKVTSGTKSCILCRLKKCFEIGMNPSLIRGQKNHSDSSRPKHLMKDDLMLSQEMDNQSADLQTKADILHYQGLKLQYRASQLRRQAIITSQLPNPTMENIRHKENNMDMMKAVSSMEMNKSRYTNSIPVNTVVRHSSDRAQQSFPRQHFNGFMSKENMMPSFSQAPTSWQKSSQMPPSWQDTTPFRSSYKSSLNMDSSRSYSSSMPSLMMTPSPVTLQRSTIPQFSSSTIHSRPGFSLAETIFPPSQLSSRSSSASISPPISSPPIPSSPLLEKASLLSEQGPLTPLLTGNNAEPLDLSGSGYPARMSPGSPSRISHTQMTGMPRLFFRKN